MPASLYLGQTASSDTKTGPDMDYYCTTVPTEGSVCIDNAILALAGGYYCKIKSKYHFLTETLARFDCAAWSKPVVFERQYCFGSFPI